MQTLKNDWLTDNVGPHENSLMTLEANLSQIISFWEE